MGTPMIPQDEGLSGALVYAYAAADAFVRVQYSNLSLLVGCLWGILQPERLHGAALHAQTAGLAGFRGCAHPVVGYIVALVVFQDVIRLEKETAARAAVADGVRPFLPVGDGMDQA